MSNEQRPEKAETSGRRPSVADAVKQIPATLREYFTRPQVWGFFVSLAVIALLALVFFHPDAAEGNQLRQHDMQQGAAIGQEVKAYMEANPDAEEPRWTNSLFSGMPTFQISPSYPSDSLFSWITTLYGLGLPSPSNLLVMMMTGMLILLMAMKVRWYYALIGAVAWGFSSYFIIIIGAGHIWKFVTLAYIPPTIAGIILAYRGRWLLGSALAALFAMMQIQSNHPQMTYYFLFVILAVILCYAIDAIRRHRWTRFLKATGALAVAAVLAVCANLPSLYNTYKYSKESMRGAHSELTQGDASQQTSGLDRDYITQYSYGRVESLSLLIPNIKGGASAQPVQGQLQPTSLASLDDAEEVLGPLSPEEQQYVVNYTSQYFGEPEGTNGPVYVGAIIFVLFVLGCIIVRGPMKWALLAMTLLSVFLALGRNMQWLTDLFIDYVPMYSKFRTVESILVIAEFTIPVLAILALQKLLTTPDAFKRYKKAIYVSFGAVTLVCLLGVLFPGIFGPAISDTDVMYSNMIGQQLRAQGYPADVVAYFSIDNPNIASAVTKLRYSMVTADSLRSLIFVLLAFGVVMLSLRMKKVKAWQGAVLIGLLVAVDLYTVDKRYLNHSSFCPPELSATDPFPLSDVDRQILADTAMNYRVMDIPGFQAAAPSFHHKTIGGYHAAKLTRYQDLIDRHLINFQRGDVDRADFNVLAMLNARYIIGPDGQLMTNPDALGNAWFVSELKYAENPDAEMAALDTIDPAVTAVADKRFRSVLGDAVSPKAPGDTIFETTYAPGALTYAARSAKGGLAVFSEVYFPWGWEATIDGKPAEIGRVNYVLRALKVPAGEHKIEMRFRPASVTGTVSVARVAVILIYVAMAAALLGLLLCPAMKPKEK